jgi:hypothetical protein
VGLAARRRHKQNKYLLTFRCTKILLIGTYKQMQDDNPTPSFAVGFSFLYQINLVELEFQHA